MRLISLIVRTLKNEQSTVFAYLLNTAVLILVFNLMLEEISVSYPLLLSLVSIVAYLVAKMVNYRRFIDRIDAAKHSIEYKYTSHIPNEALTFNAIEEMHTSYTNKLNMLNETLESTNTMFSQFIHNMKTSIAVIELAVTSDNIDKVQDIAAENLKLKNQLEQALNVLRIGDFSSDYAPEKIDLRELVSNVINKKRSEFIYAGVFPKLCDHTAIVYTDKKWCLYMIEQIVSNAIKYSPQNSSVYFTIEQTKSETILRIRDEGIGIAPEDVPRVFDLFFTGRNGRADKSATGIGLAMVKQVAAKLGHTVSISSDLEQGTLISITYKNVSLP